MRVIDGGNFTPGRVGHVEALRAGMPGKPLFVKHGPEYVATASDAKTFGFDEGRAYQDWIIPGGLIRIEEDTEFRGSNFAQPEPHTVVFEIVSAGLVNPVVRFVECNLVNVTVPDGAEIVGGNLAQVVPTETGDKDRPTVNLLHECDKCASAVMEIRDAIESKDLPKDEKGRILHHAMKDRFRARRDFEALVEADVLDVQTENDEALAKFAGGK